MKKNFEDLLKEMKEKQERQSKEYEEASKNSNNTNREKEETKRNLEEAELRCEICNANGKEEKYFYLALDRNIKRLYELKSIGTKEYKKAYNVNLSQFVKGMKVFYNNKIDSTAKSYIEDLYNLDNELFTKFIKNGLTLENDIYKYELFALCTIKIKLDAKELVALFGILVITFANIILVGVHISFLITLVPAVVALLIVGKTIFNKLTNVFLRKKLRNK